MIYVLIPCYNEASRPHLRERLQKVEAYTENCRVIIIDDGSTDDTKKEVSDFILLHDLRNWDIVSVALNKGKGHALLWGMRLLDLQDDDYILMMDADLSVSPRYISQLHDDGQCHIASRYLPCSEVRNKRPFARKLVSKIARLFLSTYFGLHLTDMQCGFKMFPAKVLLRYFDLYYPSRWLIDVQFLYAMKVSGVEIKEFAVMWDNDDRGSTMDVMDALSNVLHDIPKLMRAKQLINAMGKFTY